ncbi:MAG: Zn-ribbon domain-containing OB-fold protein [Deltaproteobacteria bacterium]|nr:Zn-ribbon domain-containing OB-fold protein [Deltaproteobacteria bacterium]MBW1919354.1 Zn-ribbon domain-containing OB-fold protein [Deltaproteobacteria bacterium]MBW1935977.1 Zn-ribbon domain-containing OB-fold protein [Deltaproteobacteria bacterium]MBW1977782.1 Zn-ribbon domain-containing OB-fold protein [Deltaproteobacteria bacterium]MBW2044257.1 Zn-ribbon domain-containing OB-fold protein [Deltaproteobacteria bacterium]
MAKKEVDDRFKKFGTVSFTSISKVNDFIDYLEKGKVAGTRCKECGSVFFPPRADCYQCLSSNMEWFEVSGTGKLLAYSKLQYGPVGFEGDLPYCIAVLDYGDYKVFGRIAGELKDEEIKIGMDMKTVVNKLPNGQLNYVFQRA